MMVFIRFSRSLTKKDSAESANYALQFFFHFHFSFRAFFSRIRIFSGLDPVFRSIRIQTQEKSLIWIWEKILKYSDPKHWIFEYTFLSF